MNRARALVGTLGVVGALSLSWQSARADSPDPTSAPGSGTAPATSSSTGAACDLTLWNGSPFIDLTIDGVTGRFLFDTGANISGVDAGWLRSSGISYSNGLSMTLGGTTGILTTPTAIVDRLEVGHGFFSWPSFLVEDFSGFGWVSGRPQAGLLGMDFISAYAVTLDLSNGRATLALANERPAPSPGETSLDLDLTTTRVPTVTARIAGIDVPCRLDTGNAYFDPRPFVDVNRAMVDTLERAGIVLVQTGTVAVAGVSGTQILPLLEGAAWKGPIGLSVGPVDVPGIVLVVHDQGTLAIDTPIALAGTPVLSRLGTFRIDPFDKKLWVSSSR